MRPLWNGEPVAGKHLYPWGEQGIGDQILFAGLLPDLIAAGAKLTIECEDRLIPLIGRSLPGVAVVPNETPPTPEGIDYFSALTDIGCWLKPQPVSAADRPPYLKADPDLTAALRARYRERGKSHVVGVAWHSVSRRFSNKSMRLADLQPLFDLPDIQFVDLQYGDTAEERVALAAATGFDLFHDDAVDQLASIDQFAAQVAALDFVVTISNATAHVAGGLGVPSVVMFDTAALWHWTEGSARSVWHPQTRLVRQAREGDWVDVVAAAIRDVTAALQGIDPAP